MYNILVVDDEEKIRTLIRKYGEVEGFRMEAAANGVEAIQKCKNEEFDLIILDIMMPVMDGFTV